MSPEEALKTFERYRKDPWAFITECVYTRDEADSSNTIKRFPNKKYLHLYAELWKRFPLIALPKTRRMTISWMTISLIVHDCIFNRARRWAFVSKKEENSDELVERVKFILENLDKTRFPAELIPQWKKTFNYVEFTSNGSIIEGFPQGADQLRQFTFSGIFGDEVAFWEQAQNFYSASLPTIDGGGRMTLVSSPAPGFFKRLVFDALHTTGDINVTEYTPSFKRPLEGIRLWQNKRNKFLILEIHYTADETKRDPSYKESVKNSMPLQDYLREYELHWDTFEGFPVYPEFGKIHLIQEKPTVVAGLPMLIGFDFGLTPAAVIGQYVEGQVIIFEEIVQNNMGAERFLPLVVEHLRLNYPTVSDLKKNWKCFVDPSGFFRNDVDERTTALIVGKYFTPSPGPVAWAPRKKAVVDLLMTLVKGEPKLQVYEHGCPTLVKGFQGGYQYPEKSVEIEPTKIRPLKNSYSHPHDALQYLCAGVTTIIQTYEKQNMPKPKYFHQEAVNGKTPH